MADTGKVIALIKAMAGSGASPEEIKAAVAEWLAEHVDPDTGYVIDDTFSIPGAAPDAKLTGDELNDLKSALTSVTGNERIALSSGYIATDGTTANINNVVSHATYYHAVVPCTAGDLFTINAQGGSTPRAFAFVAGADYSTPYAILEKSDSGRGIFNTLKEAPADSAYLVINDSGGTHISYIGAMLERRIADYTKGLYHKEVFTFSGTAPTTGTQVLDLGRTIQKGSVVKVTNNKAASMAFTPCDNFGTALANYTLTSGQSIIFYANYDFGKMSAYFGSDRTYSYTIEYQPIYAQKEYQTALETGKAKRLGKYVVAKASNVYSVATSTKYNLWAYKLNGGNYTVRSMMNTSIETNMVTCAVVNTLPIDPKGILTDMVISSSNVEASRAAEGMKEYSVAIPEYGAILLVAQSVKYESSPFVSGISSNNYTYADFCDMASNAGLTVADGKIAKGSVGYFYILINADREYPIVIKAKGGYDEYAPYIEVTGDCTYSGKRMQLLGESELGDCTEIRFPALDVGKNTYYVALVAFPDDSYIEYVNIFEEKTLHRRPMYDGVDVNAHLGFTALAPENTMPSFIAAYRSGYDAIICNPKLTQDGVWVCCHDATINRTARNADGTEIEEEIAIATTDYADLLDYDFGIAFDAAFAGTKIAKLDDFLQMCALTGVRPIFSMHESSPSQAFVESLYNAVAKWGLIKKLVLKIGTTQYSAYNAEFGDIYMFDIVVSSATAVTSAISTITGYSDFGEKKFMIDVPVTHITQAVAKEITDANIICGVYDLQAQNFTAYRQWVEWGVTQLTDDNYPVTGLKWM